jgi:hypothetical protein
MPSVFARLSLAGLAASASALPVAPREGGNAYMDCGAVAVCGVIVLETGLGDGNYRHDSPVVHGIWPEVGDYGSSQCVAPSKSGADPTEVHSCYDQRSETRDEALEFETHEWEKHGHCAGVKDESDFFTQVCGLSSAPLAVMAGTRSGGATDLGAYVTDLMGKGFPVFDKDEDNSQVQLSACLGTDGQWVLAKVADFGTACGGAKAVP